MTGREAEQTLSAIRTLMERGTQYRNLSGYAGIAAGLTTLAGSALRLGYHTPFTLTWMAVLLAACAFATFFTAQMAHENGEPFWTRQARTVVLALTPALVATLIITAVLIRAGQAAILPGVWMLLWGVGALAMSFFTPRVISLLGMTFMAAGAVVLFLPPLPDWLTMGATFGAVHLAYGVVLILIRRPRAEAATSGLGPAPEPLWREP